METLKSAVVAVILLAQIAVVIWLGYKVVSKMRFVRAVAAPCVAGITRIRKWLTAIYRRFTVIKHSDIMLSDMFRDAAMRFPATLIGFHFIHHKRRQMYRVNGIGMSGSGEIYCKCSFITAHRRGIQEGNEDHIPVQDVVMSRPVVHVEEAKDIVKLSSAEMVCGNCGNVVDLWTGIRRIGAKKIVTTCCDSPWIFSDCMMIEPLSDDEKMRKYMVADGQREI
jgi:hypothetical protein